MSTVTLSDFRVHLRTLSCELDRIKDEIRIQSRDVISAAQEARVAMALKYPDRPAQNWTVLRVETL